MTDIPTCPDCKTHGLPKHLETCLADQPQDPDQATHIKIYTCLGCQKYFKLYQKRETIKEKTTTSNPFQ